jgi:hypothetical protein
MQLVDYNERRPHDALGCVPPLTYLPRITSHAGVQEFVSPDDGGVYPLPICMYLRILACLSRMGLLIDQRLRNRKEFLNFLN